MRLVLPSQLSQASRCDETHFQVEAARDLAELLTHWSSWESLARRALTPNVFYEPWMLLPALRWLGCDGKLFVLVYRQGPPRRLAGFFPLEQRQRFKGLPLRGLSLLKHPHCFLCTPLLDIDDGPGAMSAFFRWAGHDAEDVGIVDFSSVNADGPFAEVFNHSQNKYGLSTFQDEHGDRALLRPAQNADAYLAASLSTGNRKELRRQRRRLQEIGKLESRTLQLGENVDAWIDAFLELEARGWKGHGRSALAADPAQREFFATVFRDGFARGQAQMLGLFLNDVPIALKCNFMAPPGSFAFKIAYDERLAKYSPGVQLELDNIYWLHQQPALQWMDSCAVSGHFMIERLWKDRRRVQSLWLSTGRWLGELLLAGLPLARATKRFIASVNFCW